MITDNTIHLEEKGDALDELEMRLAAGFFMDTYCETHPLYDTARALFYAACHNDQAGMAAAFQAIRKAEALAPEGSRMSVFPWNPCSGNPYPHARPRQRPLKEAILRIDRVRDVLFEIGYVDQTSQEDRALLVALFFALVSRDKAATTAAYARLGEWRAAEAWIDSDEEIEERFGALT